MSTSSPSSTTLHALFPYLTVDDTAAALAFYARVFGARELFRLTEPSGRIGHAEAAFGGTTLMLSDPYPEYGRRSPRQGGGDAVSLHLQVDDCDAVIARALAAGATLERPAQDEFYGQRGGVFIDPMGHRWIVSHTLEQVSPQEMQRRYTALLLQQARPGA